MITKRLSAVSNIFMAIMGLVFIILLYAIIKAQNYWLLAGFLLVSIYLFLTGTEALNKEH